MLSRLTTTALFAVSQVEEMLDEPILFERPQVGSQNATGSPNVEPNVVYPGDACCTFYDGATWSGDIYNVCLEEGSSVKEVNLRGTGYEDWMASWYCGPKVAYDFCDDTLDKCYNLGGNSGAGNARSSITHNYDRMSTFRLSAYDAEVRGAVTLFHDKDCTGHFGRFYAPLE